MLWVQQTYLIYVESITLPSFILQPPEVLYKIGVLKNFTTFTGKHLIVSPWVLILPPLAHHNPAIFSVPQVLQNLKKFPQAHKKLW